MNLLTTWYIKNTNGKYPSIEQGSLFEDIVINGLSARKIINPVDSTWRGGASCYITAIYSKGKIFEICDNLNNQVTKSIISSFVVN
jgi:hypothetical protein